MPSAKKKIANTIEKILELAVTTMTSISKMTSNKIDDKAADILAAIQKSVESWTKAYDDKISAEDAHKEIKAHEAALRTSLKANDAKADKKLAEKFKKK